MGPINDITTVIESEFNELDRRSRNRIIEVELEPAILVRPKIVRGG